MAYYFTSDTHFGHANIIRLCDRPFANVDEMNEVLAQRWNAVVRPNDDIWHLGDFAYKGDDPSVYFNRLNGRKHFLMGNHDDKKTRRLGWQGVGEYAEIKHNHRGVVLCHYPFAEWNGFYRGALHFHGHQHNKVPSSVTNRIDVGVDAWDFAPVSIDTLFAMFPSDK